MVTTGGINTTQLKAMPSLGMMLWHSEAHRLDCVCATTIMWVIGILMYGVLVTSLKGRNHTQWLWRGGEPPRRGVTGVRFHQDARRIFYGDIFDTPNGDVNVVYLTPHVPIAWHRHQKQDDHLWLISGMLKVKSFRDTPADMVEHTLLALPGARRVLVIPRGEWHGYEALGRNTVVLQFNGPGKYDGTDEERLSLTEQPWT